MSNPVGFTKDGRTRNWAFVVYPEWLDEGWESRLSSQKIPWCHSPVHDRDIVPETGEVKKEHIHCLILFDGSKSQKQVHEILKESISEKVPLPIPCHSVRGTVRYFCHLDDTDKAAYDPAKCFYYGCDPDSLVLPSSAEKQKYIREMQSWILQADVTEFCDLYDYAAANEPNWFHLLNTSCTIVMTAYLRSRRYKRKGEV